MADALPVKPWGKDDKDYLQKLINQCKVNISCTADTNYIDSVRHKYFRSRDNHNFWRNFQSYTHSRELEDHLSGYHCKQGGGRVFYLLFFNFMHYI
jgi:hypothetical protein